MMRENIHKVRDLIRSEPEVGNLIFQAKSLFHWLTPLGLEQIDFALENEDFDPVASRHGIRRLRLNDYAGEVVWSHALVESNQLEPDVTFQDDVITVLEENAADSIVELEEVLDERSKFPDSDALTNSDGLWSFLPFFAGSDQSRSLEVKCPFTSELLRSLRPNLLLGFAFVSVLQGGTTIGAHRGSTSLRRRYHLGIKVPDDGSPRIRIGEKWVRWKRGRAFAFNDSLEHEVINDSVDDRVALIVDLWPRSLPGQLISVLEANPSVFDFCVTERSSGSGKSRGLND